MRCLLTCSLAVLLLGAAPLHAQEKLPPGAKLIRVEAQPPAVALKHAFDYRQLLLTGILETGERVDVTRMAAVEKPANLVNLSATGLVRPLADGKGEMKFTLAGQTVAVPVEITGTKEKDKHEVSYTRDIMPVLGKLGCNAGTCHGAQTGKNGFKLSLRGYDPLFDHRALTDDESARRFNRSAPDKSLMLMKPAGAVPHVGGVLTQPGEPYYELIRAWIAAGVKFDKDGPRVVSIDIFPKNPVIPLIGMKQQMTVLATYSDGAVRDVTADSFLESSNTEVATADKAGLVTAIRRGEGAVLARFEGAYAATTLISMGDRSGFEWKDVPTNNWIDTLVYEKLKSVKILPSGLCSDADFIRRVHLDLTGLPPEPEAVRAFLTDNRETRVKREELIDKLIGSPDFVEHWTNKWSDLLQVNRKFLGEPGARAFRDWIKKAVETNMPYDKFVYQILTASGSNVENPPAAYYKIHRNASDVMENTTHAFLAIRFNCNKCHDHPFERWTQDQYYHMAAYFARIGRTEDPKFKGQKVGGTAVEGAVPLVEVIADAASGDVKHERTGVLSPPKFPYTFGEKPADPKMGRRDQLAGWLTSKDNPYFARSYVNRVWSYLLGVGLIEPVDDIRAGNPPSNPKLLDQLTADFIKSSFDVRQTMAEICKSRTYQHALETNNWNADDEVNYSHALARRLPAEVLYDAIHRATGSQARLPGLPAGARAAQLIDSNVPIPGAFLELFGKPPRESACECERSSGLMLGPVLNLVNGPVLGEALKDPGNRLAKLAATEKDDKKLVEAIFIAILCRQPTAAEIQKGLQALKDAEGDFDALVADYNKRKQTVAAYEQTLPAKQAEWEKGLSKTTAWEVLEPKTLKAIAGAKLEKQPDHSILATGPNGGPQIYTVTAETKIKGITGIRLETLTDPSLPAQGPGRAPNGNFVLNEFKVTVAPVGDPSKGKGVVLHRAQADFSQATFDVKNAIDGNAATGWAIHPELGKPHTAVFECKEPITIDGPVTLTFTLDQQYVDKQHSIGKFRLSVTTAKPPVTLKGPPEAIAKVLGIEPDKRTDADKAELARYFRSLDSELARLQRELAESAPPSDKRLLGVQDLAWALINSPAFLFNH